MNINEILSNSNFQDYLDKLDKIKVPKTCLVQDYKQSETNRRRMIRYYTDFIKKYPFRNIGRNEDKIFTIKKTKEIEMSMSYLNPLIMCAGDSANELSILAKDDSLFFHSLLQSIIVDKMAEDFKDLTIERALLWYSFNYRKQDSRKIQRYKTGVVDEINPYVVERIAEFALASTLYEKYKENRPRFLSCVKRIVIDNSGVDSLLQGYKVDLSSPEIIETLEKQEKVLTMKIPS